MRLSFGMVANLFQKRFGIIKQYLPMSEGDMAICSLSLKGNNCIMSHNLHLHFGENK